MTVVLVVVVVIVVALVVVVVALQLGNISRFTSIIAWASPGDVKGIVSKSIRSQLLLDGTYLKTCSRASIRNVEPYGIALGTSYGSASSLFIAERNCYH